MSLVSNFQIAMLCYNENYDFKKQFHRRKFTPEEDQALIYFVCKNGSYDWKKISEYMPGRTAKQCRDRYCNYLSEKTINEPWKKEEDEILLKYLSFVGPKWVEISKHIPGRSGSNVKNRWYKHLCKYYTYIPEELTYRIESNIPKIPTKRTQKKEKTNFDNIIKQYSIESLLI